MVLTRPWTNNTALPNSTNSLFFLSFSIRQSMESLQLKLVIFTVLLLVPLIQATKVEPCDRRTKYAVKITDVHISPNPVKRGRQATFSIFAFSGEAIPEGKMTIDVKFFGVHVHSEDHNLCEETSCPVPSGDFVLSHSLVLPGITPPGTYTLRVKMLEPNGNELACGHFDFSVALFADDLEAEPKAVADS